MCSETMNSESPVRVPQLLEQIYERAGYRRYKMSKFEEYDLYARHKDFLISENVLTFTDLDGRLMALKPDVTLSIVKNSLKNNGVDKVYYRENVYRSAGGGLGFREIAQAGLECIGEIDEYCICEVLSLAIKSLTAISNKCELDVSDLGILCELLDAAGLVEPTKRAAITLFGNKNRGGLRELLDSQNIVDSYKTGIIRLSELEASASDAPKKLRKILSGLVTEDGLKRFCDTCEFLASEFSDIVKVDFSTVGDLSYYSGIVFNGFVSGIPSSVLSGGQYDGLMRKMNRSAHAIGFAVYLDLLEPLYEEACKYDADALLIYGDGFSPSEIYHAAKNLGNSVLTLRKRPTEMKFRRIYKLTKEGAVEIERYD